jgi:hypothetical protein
MRECAWALSRTKNAYFRGLFARISAKRGFKKALIAVARKLLAVIYHIIKDNSEYSGEKFGTSVERQREARIKKLSKDAFNLGVAIDIVDIADFSDAQAAPADIPPPPPNPVPQKRGRKTTV